MTPRAGAVRFYVGAALRLAALIAVVLLAGQLAVAVKSHLDLHVSPDNEALFRRALALATLAYVALTALPFVPGAELGMAMLSMFGASVAPLVYGATVVSLCIAYIAGRLISPRLCAAMLQRIGARRAAVLVSETMTLPHKQRLAHMTRGVTHPQLRRLTRYRYVGLAVLINMPGNVILGGGGGLAMAAGLSGVFAPLPFVLTVMVAVLPVPLAVLMMGH